MRRSQAAKYARWSAAAALLLASVTAGAYVERKWVARVEKEKAPPPAPKDVARLLNGISFSKMAGNQKIFSVDASKSTDFKDRDASLLEDVKITIFGKTGARRDVIHTQSCQYQKTGGAIACSGEVQFDLQSADEAERESRQPGSAAKQGIHAETRGVAFDRATGTASTDQPIKFVFPNGSGQAVGVVYRSEAGEMRLLQDVQLLLVPQSDDAKSRPPTGTDAREPVHVIGQSLDFARDTRTMRLRGPVKAETSKFQLLAGELTLALDSAFRAEKMVAVAGTAGKNPELLSRDNNSSLDLSAETLAAHFSPGGWFTTVEAEGNVQGSRAGAKEAEDLRAEHASLDLVAKANQPKQAILRGNVQLHTRAGSSGEERVLQTDALLLDFAEPHKGEGVKPKCAETLSRGSIEWTEAVQGAALVSAANVQARTKLQSDKLEMVFSDEGKAKDLTATGNVHLEKTSAGKPTQTASAQNGNVQLLANGGWTQMELHGGVNLKEAAKTGQANHAVFFRAARTAVLTGKAVARDATTETRAPRITFAQSSGDILAEGGVRSTDFSSKASAVQLAPVPANITADQMQANSKTGRALYTGHARLWQGDSVLEAGSIELLRDTRMLNATGNVRAVFPQTTAPSSSPNSAAPSPSSKAKLWHVTSGFLTYLDGESRAHLEKDVVAQSSDQTMRAPTVDLYFTRPAPAGANATGVSSGPQQISSALGTGGVSVEQGARRATAERGEYSAAGGKFVMSGGNPVIYDASEGTTTGRQLTFFLADDTIIVDSESGSRTLTKHRVEK